MEALPLEQVSEYAIDSARERARTGRLDGVRVVVIKAAESVEEWRRVPARVLHLHRSGIRALLVVGRGASSTPGMRVRRWFLPRNHLNCSGHNPLVGAACGVFDSLFYEVRRPYHPVMRGIIRETCLASGIPFSEGVLAGGEEGRFSGRPGWIRLRSLGCALAAPVIVPEALCAARCSMAAAGVIAVHPQGMRDLSGRATELAWITRGVARIAAEAMETLKV
jgi:purine-nucleoside phosphorylase